MPLRLHTLPTDTSVRLHYHRHRHCGLAVSGYRHCGRTVSEHRGKGHKRACEQVTARESGVGVEVCGGEVREGEVGKNAEARPLSRPQRMLLSMCITIADVV